MQQLPEQMVIAVPLAAAVERDDQEIVFLQMLERPAGSGATDYRVAEPAAHAVEDGCAGEERCLCAGRPVEELGSEVVADEPVVTGDRESGVGACAAGPHRQRGEVEPGGPPL